MRFTMKFLCSAFFLLLNTVAFSHFEEQSNIPVHQWTLSNGESMEASFLMLKEGSVYLEKQDHRTVHFPLTYFSYTDQQYIKERYSFIEHLNHQDSHRHVSHHHQPGTYILYVLIGLVIICSLMYFAWGRPNLRFISYLLVISVIISLYSFRKAVVNQLMSVTSPTFIDSAFAPFKPNVMTSWDNNYFYVESKGIPMTDTMMVGISNHGWQQQVPIPQCYFLPNAWPIPLNPAMAANPIPVDSIHFTRGAIAIAANGVPIFNVHTNTGVDSYIDGQLDNYGGHCGRADDYHYHIAPLHLYKYTSADLPVAFGLDGYAVYGAKEPDGSNMLSLDQNHGHFGSDGIYHYHGTPSAPYMIARMAGQVTEDNTHQLVPQAAARPIRPSRTPLSGALITDCTPNGSNGYNLTYTRSGQTFHINYSWDNNGKYTFHYVSPAGTVDSVYNGFTQCQFPTSVENPLVAENSFKLFPNPGSSEFYLRTESFHDIHSIMIYNLEGRIVYQSKCCNGRIDLGKEPAGTYLVKIKSAEGESVQKLVIR